MEDPRKKDLCLCRAHSEKIVFICLEESCNKCLICPKCLLSHKNHNFNKISEYYKEEIKELGGEITKSIEEEKSLNSPRHIQNIKLESIESLQTLKRDMVTSYEEGIRRITELMRYKLEERLESIDISIRAITEQESNLNLEHSLILQGGLMSNLTHVTQMVESEEYENIQNIPNIPDLLTGVRSRFLADFSPSDIPQEIHQILHRELNKGYYDQLMDVTHFTPILLAIHQSFLTSTSFNKIREKEENKRIILEEEKENLRIHEENEAKEKILAQIKLKESMLEQARIYDVCSNYFDIFSPRPWRKK